MQQQQQQLHHCRRRAIKPNLNVGKKNKMQRQIAVVGFVVAIIWNDTTPTSCCKRNYSLKSEEHALWSKYKYNGVSSRRKLEELELEEGEKFKLHWKGIAFLCVLCWQCWKAVVDWLLWLFNHKFESQFEIKVKHFELNIAICGLFSYLSTCLFINYLIY